jgi:hypothetical protein
LKAIRTSIDVDAPAEAVWPVIEDFASYGEWNPFVVEISGEQRVGARLSVTFSIGGKRMQFRPQVIEWRPGRSLRWRGKAFAGWLFRGEHSLAVEPLSGGRTRFVHEEAFRGIAVRFVPRTLRATEQGFRAMNAALKQTVETALMSEQSAGAKERQGR